MKLLRRLSNGEHEQRKFVRMARLIAPLVLALMVFGVFGFFGSAQASAKTTSSTCENIVAATTDVFGYAGTDYGKLSLIENTCTKIHHGEFVCSSVASTGSQFLWAESTKPGVIAYLDTQVHINCTHSGQIFDTGTHGFVSNISSFCSSAFMQSTVGPENGDAAACVNEN
jgi:hypothetical protein